jgi:hypothetical protein
MCLKLHACCHKIASPATSFQSQHQPSSIPNNKHGRAQVAQLVALSVAWFVYSSWWALALNMAAMAVTAQLGTRDVWSLSPDVQRNRAHLVAYMAALAACYFFPMVLQSGRDGAAVLAAARGGASAVAGAAASSPPPSLAAAGYAAGTLASLIFGAAVFATGFPERAWPGVFDTVGFSHQLMHLGAIGAFVCEYLFTLEMWSRRHRDA